MGLQILGTFISTHNELVIFGYNQEGELKSVQIDII